MSRTLTRTLAILVGLTVGFVSAGYVTWPSLLGSASYAQTQPAEDHTSASHLSAPHDTAHADAGEAAAAGLVPVDEHGRPATPGWYRYVVGGIIALFALALAIGIPLTRLNREPSRPTNDHAH